MACIYSEYTYSVCVSRGLWWNDLEKYALTGEVLLPLVALNVAEQQLPLSGTTGITQGGTANRTMIFLSIKICICTSIYMCF